MFHSDPNNDDIHEGATTPYRPAPQPPAVPPEDSYRSWTNPNQYVPPGDRGRWGENYGPSGFPTQGNMGQRQPSSRPDYPHPGDPHLAPSEVQMRQLPMWGTPV